MTKEEALLLPKTLESIRIFPPHPPKTRDLGRVCNQHDSNKEANTEFSFHEKPN